MPSLYNNPKDFPKKEEFEKFLKDRIPFYNLYPTQSNWNAVNEESNYIKELENLYKNEIIPSLYLHFPFCPKQCYFCHCYTVISRQDDHYRQITKSIIKELNNLFILIKKLTGKEKIKINNIHFGGGTPTVIPMDLFNEIMEIFKLNLDEEILQEIAIEVDPRNGMDEKKLLEYSRLGVNRISIGIQDFDDQVQVAVNRVNSFEMIDNLLTKKVRDAFKSINFDFIYGLPKQTRSSISNTAEKIVKLKPDRIHCLNLEHRPDVYKHQRAYKEQDLPEMFDKMQMYYETTKFLESSGYERIGLHKFAKSTDILSKFKKLNKLYRNPNGYSPGWTYNMLAVGPSSTGKIGDYYFQNIYSLDEYKTTVSENKIPIIREKKWSKEDSIRHKVIMDLLSFEKIYPNKVSEQFNIKFEEYFDREILNLNEFVEDGYLEYKKNINEYIVTERGSHFINNICHIFDSYSKFQYASHREFEDGVKSFDRSRVLRKI